jgi:hypothetical protein
MVRDDDKRLVRKHEPFCTEHTLKAKQHDDEDE